jgi:hypothetical protein
MDIASHALWTAAGATTARQVLPPIRPVWAAFWGVFPDVFSFTLPAAVRIWWFLSGQTTSLLPQPGAQQFQFVWQLYHCSHSAVVFAAVFGLVWLALSRAPLALLGWALHIAIDIPTHRGMFAIHFLWPLSSFGVNGIPWESRWLLAANFAALAVVYGWMWRARRRRLSSGQPSSCGRL